VEIDLSLPVINLGIAIAVFLLAFAPLRGLLAITKGVGAPMRPKVVALTVLAPAFYFIHAASEVFLPEGISGTAYGATALVTTVLLFLLVREIH
jgi:hypothetical protein